MSVANLNTKSRSFVAFDSVDNHDQFQIERRLVKIESLLRKYQKKVASPTVRSGLNPDIANHAMNEYRIRRSIDRIFDFKGFSQSPAWDIMLDLFVSGEKGASISVSSACIGAACPNTTGLRWLRVLQDMDLLIRSDDPSDKRRALVVLTNDGWTKTRKAIEQRFGS